MIERKAVPKAVSSAASGSRSRRNMIYLVAAGITATMIGAFATSSFSQGFGGGFGSGFGYGGRPSLHDVPFGQIDPAIMAAHADRMIRHLAIELDATPEQQAKLSAIVKAAVKDLAPIPEKALAARRQGRDLLTQQTIDRTALEKLRADEIATFDTASKRLVQALADTAEVLTPEQRRKLDDMLPPPDGRAGWRNGPGPDWGIGGFWRR